MDSQWRAYQEPGPTFSSICAPETHLNSIFHQAEGPSDGSVLRCLPPAGWGPPGTRLAVSSPSPVCFHPAQTRCPANLTVSRLELWSPSSAYRSTAQTPHHCHASVASPAARTGSSLSPTQPMSSVATFDPTCPTWPGPALEGLPATATQLPPGWNGGGDGGGGLALGHTFLVCWFRSFSKQSSSALTLPFGLVDSVFCQAVSQT